MRHNKKINHLGRTSSHRKAMLSNMSISLIKDKRINTTIAKAKALRKVIEPIINKSKDNSTHSRRLVFQDLGGGAEKSANYYAKKRDKRSEVFGTKEAVTELFQNIAPKVAERAGGYTRIIKTGFRLGDNAAMCFIELVDFNDDMLKAPKAAAKAKTRRSRKATPKAETADVAEEVVKEKKAPKEKEADTETTKDAE